ncbi:glycosyltransferase family 4 protein [Acidobacteriota bacterium]
MKRLLFKSMYNWSKSWTAVFLFQIQLGRLKLERLFARKSSHRSRFRVMATACWEFPIYSQTFVYQELLNLIQNRFDVRFLYFHLNSFSQLPSQFVPLWRSRRRVFLHPEVCKRALAYYKKRKPERVEKITGLLCRESGMSSKDLQNHRHFMQAFSFTRAVEAYLPDYLHSYFFYEGTLFTMIASYLLDIPRGVSGYTDHMLKDYELKLVPLHLKHSSLIIATSERIKQELMDIEPQVDPNHIIVKPNAINTGQYPIVSRQGIESQQPYRLICVSRIEPKKGLHYLVEAVRILRNRGFEVMLHLLGGVDNKRSNREYARELDQRIKDLKLVRTVHLEGRRTESEIKHFLATSHMFVAPFVETESGDKDGIPTSLLEAMSTGLPVITTDAGSILEVIDDGQDGVIVPQRDSNALATSIADLINNKEQRELLGRNASKKVHTKFDVSMCEHLFHNRLRQILKSRPNAVS